ncbi:exported hypothetical protein [Candidatus Zixiibacteriota bacterium]|nr:exported hypothetical protein [candidate division Zixibacteria bacterium]
MSEKKLRLAGLIILSLMILQPAAVRAQGDETKIVGLFQNYLDLIVSGNYESARGLWHPDISTRDNRLGINYEGIEIKSDCGSPAVYATKQVRNALLQSYPTVAALDSDYYRVNFLAQMGEQKLSHYYYMKKFGQDFWFIQPQDYFAVTWPVKESKYFRFHVNPVSEKYFNDYGVSSLDDFIDRVATRINIPPERLAVLAQNKIDYYLCSNETEVGRITGHVTRGEYDLASDAVITCIFPHYHEVGHLLVNFKLQNLPLFTRSFMQEGTAVFLGGRWQRSSDVMLDFGGYIVRYDIANLDSILINADTANPLGADINYPVAACFADYMITNSGLDKFFTLYRALSGDYASYIDANVDSLKNIITSVTGRKWDDLQTDFTNFCKIRLPKEARIFPGDVVTSQALVTEKGFDLSASDKWIKVVYHPDSTEKTDASFLFDKDAGMKEKKSTLFDEQFKGKETFAGYRYGIRLDKNEIGVYDYFTNQLIAKYVRDFNPSPAYYDSTANRLTAFFDWSVLGDKIPEMADHELIE